RIHQNGKKNRFKIRTRSYLNNNESFLELKQKNNKNRTSKKRKKLDNSIPSDNQVIMSYVKKHVPDFSRELKKSLNIHFSRITLADKNLTERITIDLGLTYKRDMAEKSYPRLVIVEVKQDQYNHYSTIIKKLHERRIYPFRISKYCLGIYSLYSNDEVKKNMMKVKMRALEKCLGTI
ncbi:MAG: hypothetical protein JEY91_17340, partial [Spirochaetaceae bacterium]|nr:hypothetical protein [Spirochaetaceae bacterium]